VTPPAGYGHERSPLGLMVGPARATLVAHEDELAAWLQTWAVLLLTQGSQSNTFLEKVAPLLELDPELESLATIGQLVGDTQLSQPLFRVLDTPEVAAALGSSTSGRPGHEGVLGLLGRLSSDGSLEQVLVLLTWVADTVGDLGLVPPE